MVIGCLVKPYNGVERTRAEHRLKNRFFSSPLFLRFVTLFDHNHLPRDSFFNLNIPRQMMISWAKLSDFHVTSKPDKGNISCSIFFFLRRKKLLENFATKYLIKVVALKTEPRVCLFVIPRSSLNLKSEEQSLGRFHS